ncbi:trypsin-like serine peptidase [Azospirillum sp. sgz302134]
MKTYQERLIGLLALSVALIAAPALAQNLAQKPALPGIGAEDRRTPVDLPQAPWRSLVKVQNNLGGRCTGVLVAPRRVVTAAHCLLNRARQYLPASSLHVLFGYARGEYQEHRTITALTIGGPYDPERKPEGLAGDWAVLTLDGDAPAGVEPLPLARSLPPKGTPLMLGGYSQDKAHIITADTACAALGTVASAKGPLLVHDCAGTRGVSGAALLVRDGEGWRIAGIAVAATTGPAPRAVAVPAAAFSAAIGGTAIRGNTPSLR